MIYETMRPLKTAKTEELLNDSRIGWEILNEIHKLTDKESKDDERRSSKIKGFSELHISLNKNKS